MCFNDPAYEAQWDRCSTCYDHSECPGLELCFGLEEGFYSGICDACADESLRKGLESCLWESPKTKDCFPADASVVLSNGSTKKMNELEIGDNVKVGENQFSKVYTFTHRDHDIMAKFVQIHLRNGNILELSHAHYLYVNEESNIIPAHLVRSGDLLIGDYGQKLVVAKTMDITKRGLFNPHTVTGDIIVNGIKTTTYTEAVQVSAAHSLLAPIRALFTSTGKSTTCLDNISDYRM